MTAPRQSRVPAGAAIAVSVVVLLCGLTCTWIAAEFLSEEPSKALFVAGVLASALAALGFWRLQASASRRVAVSIQCIVVCLIVFLPLSSIWPGGISYGTFGLTVVGVCPVPGLDVVLTASGHVAFRKKSHAISAAEIKPLLDGAEVVIIATGWDGMCDVDPAVLSIQGVKVHILRTEPGIDLYRTLRRAGTRVAVLLHSTC